MKLGELDIQNFMSVEAAETNLADKGLVLIQGANDDDDTFESNGSGKSTVFSEAITWVLTGETIRGQKGDKVINRAAKKNTRVSQTLYDDNGDVYEIIRHRKHSQHGNHVLMFRNGENITGKSDTDTNKAIEELIGMDFLTFTNSVMFGQGISKLFASTTDSEQKKILEQMLQIDVFRLCQEKAKEHVDSYKQQISDTNGELQNYRRLKTSHEDHVSELQAKEAALGEKVDIRIAELTGELRKWERELSELGLVSDLMAERDMFTKHIESYTVKLAAFKEHDDSKSELSVLIKSSEREVTRLETAISTSLRDLENIRSGKDIPKTCKACGQSLPLDDTSHMEKHLEDGIEENRNRIGVLESEQVELQSLLSKVNKALEGKAVIEKTIEELKEGVADVQSDIRQLTMKRKTLEESINLHNKLIAEQEELRNATYASLIQEELEKIVVVDEAIQDCTAILERLYDESAQYEFWLTAFGNQGIKSVLLDSVTPYLNQRCNYYLSKLAGNSIEVTFNTQTTLKSGEKRDKFAVEVDNKNGDDDYKSNSGGEKRRVDIAINMALQDLVLSRTRKKLDIIVYDECFDGLDAIGCESVIHLLHEKAKSCGSIFVITHNDNLKQLFNKSMRVRKSSGKTIVEEEVV